MTATNLSASLFYSVSVVERIQSHNKSHGEARREFSSKMQHKLTAIYSRSEQQKTCQKPVVFMRGAVGILRYVER